MNRTHHLAVAVVAGAALALAAAPAYASGTPSATSNSHLNIRIPLVCDGEQLTVVAGDSDHATAQIVQGGDGHLIPVSMTFTAADGSSSVIQISAHSHQPTVTCIGTDMSGQGGSVTITAIRKP